MDENGTISEIDTTTMHKSILPLSRTLHYLQDKAHAFEVLVREYFGENSWVHRDAAMWTSWIDDNFHELQEIRASRDPELPVKIEVIISNRFNRIFRAAMLGVPDQELFNQTMLDGILNRTSYLELPSAVRLALTNSSKRRNESTTNTTNNNSRQTRQRTGIVRVNHDNQPNEIKISSDEYRSKATPFLQTNKNKVPQFDDTTDECLKFAYLGYCNTDCPRAKAHTTIKCSTKCFENVTQFKNQFTKASAQADFQNREVK